MTGVVLDASAIIAVLNSEPGEDLVLGSMANGLISAVNYSEVVKKAVERLQERTPIPALLRSYWIEIVPFDEDQAIAAGELFGPTKQLGLSFADRACLALGIQRKCKVLTSESRMAEVTLPITVKLIRNAH